MDINRKSHIGRLLLELNKDFTSSAVEIIQQSGFRDVQTSYIFFIAAVDLEGTPLSEVINRTRSSKQAVNKVLVHLEKLNLIERRVSEADSRARVIHFTSTGRRFMKVAIAAVKKVEDEYKKSMGNAGFLDLKKGLQLLAEKRINLG